MGEFGAPFAYLRERRMTHGSAGELTSRRRRSEMFGGTQKIEKAVVSRRGLKCVWLPVREMNRDRLIAIWIHVAI
jgi:hypothetical protein